MSTLYEVSAEIQELFQLAEEEDVSMDVLNDTFEGLAYEFENKCESYAVIMNSLQGEADALDKEIRRLSGRKKTLENNVGRMKKAVEAAMIATGKRKFKTKLFDFRIQKNNPSLQIIDKDLIDSSYYEYREPALNTAKLLTDVKADPEAFAGVVELKQTESIRIS